jgi:serine/threonine protein kinase
MEQLGVYRIDRELGRGAMGVVYKAWDTISGREAAVKVMLTAASDTIEEDGEEAQGVFRCAGELS